MIKVVIGNLTNNLSWIKDESFKLINVETFSITTVVSVLFAGFVILSVNGAILKNVIKQKYFTFINMWILIHCLNSVAHVPILTQFL